MKISGIVSRRLRTPLVVVLSSATTLFLVALHSNLSNLLLSTKVLARDSPLNATPTAPRQCPVIVYNKQIKTGSTYISNVLYRTTEAYGCRNANCRLQKTVMMGNISHVPTSGGLVMSCHSKEWNHRIIENLRLSNPNNFFLIGSVREPISWIRSTACFFYALRKYPEDRDKWDDQRYKEAIDWILSGKKYQSFQNFLFESLGMKEGFTEDQIFVKLLDFDILIDNKNVTDGLDTIGRHLGWKMLSPTVTKPLTYRGPLYDTYRIEELKNVTTPMAMLYRQAQVVMRMSKQRPRFAGEPVNVENRDGDDVDL